ncbi:hypothetical protein ACTA71_000168 [Dictyostelium dimigraforme]
MDMWLMKQFLFKYLDYGNDGDSISVQDIKTTTHQSNNGSEDQDIQADYSSYLARVLKFTWKNIKNRDDSKSSKARSIFLICYNCDHKYESAQNNNRKGLEEKGNL